MQTSNFIKMLKTSKMLLICAILSMGAISANSYAQNSPNLARLNTLAQSKNCFSCHAVEKKVLGPGFKEVAQKYGGKMDPNTLAEKIKKGGSGKWSPVPMPANPQISEAEAKELATLILGLK